MQQQQGACTAHTPLRHRLTPLACPVTRCRSHALLSASSPPPSAPPPVPLTALPPPLVMLLALAVLPARYSAAAPAQCTIAMLVTGYLHA